MTSKFSFLVIIAIITHCESDPSTNELPHDEFQHWDVNMQEGKNIIVVDKYHKSANNLNPGTNELPLSTINEAILRAKPGDQIEIREGVYNEVIRPKLSGNKDSLIHIVGAANGKTVISGAVDLISKTYKCNKFVGKKDHDVISIDIPDSIHHEIVNAFTRTNASIEQLAKISGTDFFEKKAEKENLKVMFLPSALVIHKGDILSYVQNFTKLISSNDLNAYWYDINDKAIHVKLKEKINVGDSLSVKIGYKQHLLIPEKANLGYIHLDNLHFEMAANQFPWPQKGMVSTNRGHHWIIENCSFQFANAISLDIGMQWGFRKDEKIIGHHIIRNNKFISNGICGLSGLKSYNNLVEDNYFENNAWHNAEFLFESASIKLHRSQNTLIRNNIVSDTKNGPGIWVDFLNLNSRCTGNFIINTNTRFGAIFFEASNETNWVDNNFIYNSTGNGIYQHDCDSLIITSNVISNCNQNGIKIHKVKNRKIKGKPTTADYNEVLNNRIFECANDVISISDKIIIQSNYANTQNFSIEIDSLSNIMQIEQNQIDFVTKEGVPPNYLLSTQEKIKLDVTKYILKN